jgi:3-oxoacyl-[acyl-carrier-protein] synthase II
MAAVPALAARATVQHSRRVVVTGMGLVTPLGVGTQHTWKALKEGKSGIAKVTRYDPDAYPLLTSKIAAVVPYGTKPGEFDPSDITPLEERHMSLGMRYSTIAANEALEDANWSGATLNDKQLEVS